MLNSSVLYLVTVTLNLTTCLIQYAENLLNSCQRNRPCSRNSAYWKLFNYKRTFQNGENGAFYQPEKEVIYANVINAQNCAVLYHQRTAMVPSGTTRRIIESLIHHVDPYGGVFALQSDAAEHFFINLRYYSDGIKISVKATCIESQTYQGARNPW